MNSGLIPKSAMDRPHLLPAAILLLFASQFYLAAAQQRLVLAHYMLWAPSSSDNIAGFKSEIEYAQKKSIDAFVLNTNVWGGVYKTRADQIYQAAQELNTGFKICFSLDMHRDGNGHLSSADVREMITRYRNHPNQLYYNGRQFVSTWLGGDQDTKFDEFADPVQGWTQAIFNQIGGKNLYYFVPFFPTGGTESEVTSVINRFGSILDGLYAWDTSAWPYFNGDFQNPSDAKDAAYAAACGRAGKTFMASVSPWFFKNVDCCNDVCATSDQVRCSCQVKGNYKGPGLWIERWKQILRRPPQFVEIVTWNDWVERSYVAPIGNPLWGPQASNDMDFPHAAFLELGDHHIRWYKGGGAEPAITKDSTYIFYYSHSKSAIATSQLCRVQNSATLDDRLYVVTMLPRPAQLLVRSGNGQQSFDVPAGYNLVSIPLQAGTQSATLSRNGAKVHEIVGKKAVSNSIANYDFNVYSDYVRT